jgi:signal transduction histidine kinase
MLTTPSNPLLRYPIVALVGAVFVFDLLTSLDIAIEALYVIVVVLSAHAWVRRGWLAVIAACIALTFLAAHGAAWSAPAATSFLVSLAALGIAGYLAMNARAASIALREREASLRRSEALLAVTQRLSRSGSFCVDVGSGRIQWSEEAARIAGLPTPAETSLAHLLERIPRADLDLLRRAIERGHAGESSIEVRHGLQMPDGTVKQVRVLASASVDANGARLYVAAIMDLTAACDSEQARRSLARLAHATRVTTLGELTASIVHEVNQPLAAIGMNGNACLRWIDRAEPNLPEARAAVQRLLEASCRAAEMITRIRAMARRSDPQRLPVDLNQVAREAAALMQCELVSHQVPLTLALEAGLPAVLGDRVQLQQVVINLLMNGMQAISAHGSGALRLQTRQDDDDVRLLVSDTGPGISKENRARLFEPFYTTKPDGMGMGLPICRSIIEVHGGHIGAQPGAGKGTTVAFSLPRWRAAPLKQAAPTT